jgi:nucleoside-diphosphate-sugar epimerase
VLITGATGFVGTALCDALPAAGFRVRRALRTGVAAGDDSAVGAIDGSTDWRNALRDVSCVVHLAARAHVMHEHAPRPMAAYRAINVDGTRELARQAAEHGIQRFIFLSSVKVNGEATHGAPFRETDTPRPEDAYGSTKHEAELLLHDIAETSNMQLAVLRPPLVYGAGVKGNFLRLMNLVARGFPLPVSSIRNRRSVVYVGNLVDAIIACLRPSQTTARTYLVADDEAPSTPALVLAIAHALNSRARMLPCPVSALGVFGAVTGKSGEISRLTRSLEIDASRIRTELGWHARYTLAQGLRETARWYHAHRGARQVTE